MSLVACNGQITGEAEENAYAAIVDARLCALANLVAIMTPAQKSRLMGPRDFGPSRQEEW